MLPRLADADKSDSNTYPSAETSKTTVLIYLFWFLYSSRFARIFCPTLCLKLQITVLCNISITKFEIGTERVLQSYCKVSITHACIPWNAFLSILKMSFSVIASWEHNARRMTSVFHRHLIKKEVGSNNLPSHPMIRIKKKLKICLQIKLCVQLVDFVKGGSNRLAAKKA